MKKGPAINYVCKKFSTTKKSVLFKQLEDYPLNTHDYSLVCDMINGLSITELSLKFNKTPSRISQWKREVCEKIQAFDVANLKR